MPTAQLSQKLLSEALGTAFLLATVIGSGIMGAKLSGGNVALALLGNTIATGAILVVLILVFGPLSGAHFNPAVTLAVAARGTISRAEVLPYIVAQLLGAVIGVWVAHAMFDLSIWQVSTTLRWGAGQWIAEVVATCGLLLTIMGTVNARPDAVPFAVGLYITSAYWFTASTSFANPAVTIARGLSDTFAGIAPTSIGPFIVTQGLGACLALAIARVLWPVSGRA